jgi:predicted transcriptional regulator
MKHIIKAVYEKATLAKADLMMIERWVMQLQPNWINNISNIQQEVNWFTSLLIRKLIDSGLVGKVQHDFTLKTRSQSTYVSNNEQTEAHSAEKLENMINLFKKIHNELTFVSNRYLCVDEA